MKKLIILFLFLFALQSKLFSQVDNAYNELFRLANLGQFDKTMPIIIKLDSLGICDDFVLANYMYATQSTGSKDYIYYLRKAIKNGCIEETQKRYFTDNPELDTSIKYFLINEYDTLQNYYYTYVENKSHKDFITTLFNSDQIIRKYFYSIHRNNLVKRNDSLISELFFNYLDSNQLFEINKISLKNKSNIVFMLVHEFCNANDTSTNFQYMFNWPVFYNISRNVKAGKLIGFNIANFIDGLCSFHFKKQVFGTLINDDCYTTKKVKLRYPLFDSKNVNKLRADFNMFSLEEFKTIDPNFTY